MTQEEIRLRCLEAVISKAPQGFSAEHVIKCASLLVAFVTPDTPSKRGPGRPPKQTTTQEDTA